MYDKNQQSHYITECGILKSLPTKDTKQANRLRFIAVHKSGSRQTPQAYHPLCFRPHDERPLQKSVESIRGQPQQITDKCMRSNSVSRVRYAASNTGDGLPVQTRSKILHSDFGILFINCLLVCFWQNFNEIDANKDGYVTPEEIYDIKYDDLERLLGYYMEEEESEEEGDNMDLTEQQDEQTEGTSVDSTEGTPDPDNTDREHTEL